MRKKVVHQGVDTSSSTEGEWLDLERLAQVEVTSEDPAHPIENALLLGKENGWRALQSGEQRLRLEFDEPQNLQRIQLVFDEHESSRTQEFVLLWSPREVEDYTLNLSGISTLELRIVPHLGAGKGVASLTRLRLR